MSSSRPNGATAPSSKSSRGSAYAATTSGARSRDSLAGLTGPPDLRLADRVPLMEVRIGVVYTPREVVLEMGDDADTVSALIEKAVNEKSALVWLVDSKGKRLGIPIDKLAYVEIAGADADRKVGFGSR
jgi:hypothetical protein